MNNVLCAAGLILLSGMAGRASLVAHAEERPWSERAANAAIERWPDGRLVPAGQRWAWNYELGTLLEGMDAVWLNTADPRYYNYIKSSVDQFVAPDGSIPTWKVEEYQLDNILLGRQLLLLYGVTQDPRYAKAATLLYQQLVHQPRNPSGGFWHKQRYPNQMWLDGLYMAEPFYAEYASTFHHPEAFNLRCWTATPAMRRPACSTTDGMNRNKSAGQARKPACHRSSGPEAWAGR